MSHPDLEFQVESENGRHEGGYHKGWKEACGAAVEIAVSHGVAVHIDVLTWSRKGARAWGGDDAVERYEEDPEASVFERFVISADSQGRIP